MTTVRDGSAGALVLAEIAIRTAELRDSDPSVRAGEDDAVHPMRVTTRRLRSVLATYHRLLDRTVTDRLRDELRWLAAVLGAERDLEVMSTRLARAFDETGTDEAVRRFVEDVLRRRHRAAHRKLVRTLDTKRYQRLLTDLAGLVADPPLRGRASKPADRVLPALVGRSWQRVRRAQEQHDSDRDPRLHEVRKAAKRARYAAEVAAPVIGKPARRFAKAHKRIQSTLGHHQDAVVCRGLIRELAGLADDRGLGAFDLGRLHAGQDQLADRLDAAFTRDVWPKASRPALRRWLP